MLELVTVIGSDLFDLDDDIKQYLQDPTMPLITAIKIGLRYYITSDLILQLQVLKDHLNIESFEKISLYYPKSYNRIKNITIRKQNYY